MSAVYLDSSSLLAVVFGQVDSEPTWTGFDQVFTSSLTWVEVSRTLHRMEREQPLFDARAAMAAVFDVGRAVTTVELTPAIQRRAADPFPNTIRTLDAIHLATALLIRETEQPDLVFATHDRQQAQVARSLGFGVIGTEK